MSIVKVIEVLADSPNSWEEATKNAVASASKTVKNIKSVWIKDQSAVVDGGAVKSFRVTLKVSFLINN